MNANTETTTTTAVDKFLLLVGAALVVVGVVAYYYFEQQSILIRVAGLLGAIIVGLLVGAATNPGRRFWRFAQVSRVELKKVVWPTNQETMQTTIVVIIFVLILGAFFWVLDRLLLEGTKFLTGQG